MQYWSVVLFLGIVINCQKVTDQIQKAVVSANSQFALDLLRQLSKNGNENVFFSPLSISAAFAMTSLGARGKTLTEINRAFHFDQVHDTSRDPMALHKVFKQIITLYKQETDNINASLANRLYCKQQFRIQTQFMIATKRYYGVTMEPVDFNGQAEVIINRWVKKQTHGKIKDIIKPASLLPNTILVLVNAFYFKGVWETKFNPWITVDRPFYTPTNEKTTVRMMQVTHEFNYFQDKQKNVQVLEMPYAGKNISMIVILPKFGRLQTFISKLTAEKLENLISSLTLETVHVKLPRFELETEYSLKETLQLLGVNDLFRNSANLKGMNDKTNLKLSKVQHKAKIAVDEEGSVAVAATGIVLAFKSASFIKRFIANHPFLFVIRDMSNGEVLFIGSVNTFD